MELKDKYTEEGIDMNELSYRQIHLDFHTSPLIDRIGSEFDAVSFADTLVKAHVGSINIFAKCHHGMCYYPTKIGRIHPNLHFDLMGAMIDACHQRGIKCPIYIPIGWEEVSAEEESLLEVGEDGVAGHKRPFDDGYYKWRKLCLGKRKYIDFVLAQTDEIIDNYNVDGFWYDIVFQSECLCPDCIHEMKEEGLSPQNKQDVRKHDFQVVERFMKEVREHVNKRLPEATTFFNMSLAPDNGCDSQYSIRRKLVYQTHIEIESLPSGEWGYDHFPLLSNYLNTFPKQLIGMTGKFHKSWGDHGTLKNMAALEFECYRMLANGAKCCIGDQLHPSGKLDPIVYEHIGKIYKKVEEYEPWCKNSEKVNEIGVYLCNEPLRDDFTTDKGVMHMLMELHRPFSFLDQESDFNLFKLIIFPDNILFDETLLLKTKAYLKSGGKILATNKSGLNVKGTEFALQELNVKFEQMNPYCPSYFNMMPAENDNIEKFNYVVYEQGTYVKPVGDVAVLGRIGESYFNRTYDHFSSHCQSPFNKLTGYPVVVYGKNAAYIAYPIFHNYMKDGVKVYRDLVEKVISLLIDEPLIRTNLPKTAELSIRQQSGRKLVHILHYIPQRKCENLDTIEDVIPLYNVSIEIKTDKKPRKVYSVSQNEELIFEYKNGYAKTVIPEVKGYEILAIQEM